MQKSSSFQTINFRRVSALMLIVFTLNTSAMAQIRFSLNWSINSFQRELPDGSQLLTFSYNAIPNLIISQSPFATARIESPSGYIANFSGTSGSGSGPGLRSSDELLAALTRPWTLTTNYGLADARTYTFFVNPSRFDFDPFRLLEPATFTDLIGLTRVKWSGPVDLAPVTFSYNTSTPTPPTNINLGRGATEWQGTLPANLSNVSVRIISTPVDFADVSTPVDSNGLPLGITTAQGGFFSLWRDDGERAMAGISWSVVPAAPIPEPSTWLAGVTLLVGAILAYTIRRSRTSI